MSAPPTLVAGWINVVSLLIDAAVRGARGEDVAELTTALAEATAALSRRAEADNVPISRLRGCLELSATEELVVWCLVAQQLDQRVATAFEALANGPEVTIGALRDVVYVSNHDLAFAELSPSARLFRLSMIEFSEQQSKEVVSWSRRHVRLSDRVLALALMQAGTPASDNLDHAIASIDENGELSVGVLAMNDVAINSAREAVKAQRVVIVASGPVGRGRRTMLRYVAKDANVRLLEVNAKRLPKEPEIFKQQLKMIARECLLLGRAPLIRNIDALVDDKDTSRVDMVGSELVSELSGPVFVTCGVQRPAMRWGRPCIVIDVKPPSSAQRAQLWLRELGQGSEEDAEYLATQYPLAPALIHHASNAAKARAAGRNLTPEDIYAGIRAVLDDRLGNFAKRVEVTQTWDDLVLPQDQQDAVTYLIARIRQRRTVYEQWGFAQKVGKGLGVSALFSGPPGTGKTMVAALIAKELGLELYQVDMAKMVSKWIGETERNLAELFDAAEAGHAILLFDEADSLFGKRTDVKSSNDRYANLETNYLLQRLESFTGICLLTSNHESNIDPAFQRRLSLHLRFDLPEVAEREALWRAMIPLAAPVEPNLDVASLAKRFAMSGGYIRNAALRAAFIAADEGSVITSAHLERAARLEYEGMGKIAA